MKIVYLNVTSWVGSLAYAEHFYGRLTTWVDRKSESYDVVYLLTREDANRLNDDGDKIYEEGDESSRFFSHAAVIKAALEQWKTRWPDADALLLGESCVLDPMEVLAGPDPLMCVGNEIVKQCYATGYYDADEHTDEHKALRTQWRSLL